MKRNNVSKQIPTTSNFSSFGIGASVRLGAVTVSFELFNEIDLMGVPLM